ncbi:MAG: sodium/solute symporter [Enterobacterales bacterium]|nr:sodium/solute symporter [Enterobacterales bacterium]
MAFSGIDWFVFIVYFSIIALTGWYFSRVKVTDTNTYFLGGHKMPLILVAISLLATSQSAATFLGGPDQGYRADLTYLATNLGTILAAIFVAKVMLPRFYELRVSTVYELLQRRFGSKTKQGAGAMYLVGRVFASGARLYMAAIAVAMILFQNVDPTSVIIAICILSAIGLLYSFVGGIRAVIYSDAIQCVVYVFAAIAVIYFLMTSISVSYAEIIQALQVPIDGSDSKLRLLDFRLNFGAEGTFSVWASLTGFLLLGIASFGMDQDMTQRLLTCKSAAESTRAMLLSMIFVIPVVLLFMMIGLLLYVFYQRPELMSANQTGELIQSFDGEKITIFMYYVLNEMPAGLRGLVTVGIVAAALSTLNSGLNSMSSVIVQDFYRPWQQIRQKQQPELHFVFAGRIGMLIATIALASMAILSFYWQRYTDMPLLAFALSVMVFAYSGLLGVYFNALFTTRGNTTSALLALIAGFLTTLFFQPYIQAIFNMNIDLAFPYQLTIATSVAFLVCFAGRPKAIEAHL